MHEFEMKHFCIVLLRCSGSLLRPENFKGFQLIYAITAFQLLCIEWMLVWMNLWFQYALALVFLFDATVSKYQIKKPIYIMRSSETQHILQL